MLTEVQRSGRGRGSPKIGGDLFGGRCGGAVFGKF